MQTQAEESQRYPGEMCQGYSKKRPQLEANARNPLSVSSERSDPLISPPRPPDCRIPRLNGHLGQEVAAQVRARGSPKATMLMKCWILCSTASV